MNEIAYMKSAHCNEKKVNSLSKNTCTYISAMCAIQHSVDVIFERAKQHLWLQMCEATCKMQREMGIGQNEFLAFKKSLRKFSFPSFYMSVNRILGSHVMVIYTLHFFHDMVIYT